MTSCLTCRPCPARWTLIPLLCSLLGPGSVAAASEPGASESAAEHRAAAVVWAEDAFSRRAAEQLVELGFERLARQPGFEALPAEALVVTEADPAERAAYQAALEQSRRGIASYENLEPVQAVAQLRSAVTGFERVSDLLHGKRRAAYLQSLTYLGASLILKGDLKEGQAAFRQLLVLDRDRRLNKRLFPPGMMRMFEAARQELADGRVGSLAVFSSPAHARIYIDGAFRGVTPKTVERLAEGRHQVQLCKAGYQTWAKTVDVTAAEEQPVRCRLLDLPGGEDLLQAVAEAAGQLGKRLAPRLQALALGAGLDRLAVGRVAQREQSVGLSIAWYDVRSGQRLRSLTVELRPDSEGFAGAVGSVFSYLLSGRRDVLQSPAPVMTDSEPLRLRGEALFEESEVPFYERWYFWTAIGAGVAAAVGVTLGVLLGGDKAPASQILLEF